MIALEILKRASGVPGFSEMQLFISKDKLDEAIKELEAIATAAQQSTQSKFNVGDWVVYPVGIHGSEEILQITNIDKKGFCSFRDCSKMYQIDKLELWKPRPGEWCWVFNDKSQIPVIRKFLGIHDKENSILPFVYIVEEHDKTTMFYRHIEPFIGALPSTIEQY